VLADEDPVARPDDGDLERPGTPADRGLVGLERVLGTDVTGPAVPDHEVLAALGNPPLDGVDGIGLGAATGHDEGARRAHDKSEDSSSAGKGAALGCPLRVHVGRLTAGGE